MHILVASFHYRRQEKRHVPEVLAELVKGKKGKKKKTLRRYVSVMLGFITVP